MPALLHIDSSPRTQSVSSRLAAQFVQKWVSQHPGATVTHHNTSIEKMPYIDEAMIEAFYTPVEARTVAQKQLVAYSDQLVDELLAADVVVIGTPMWNLGIPASLKAWIDLIVRAGRTFGYTQQGVQPLVPAGKKVYVIAARGGAYPAGTPYKAYDQQEPYLRSVLGFIGLTDVEFIYADNQSRNPEAAAEGLAAAEDAVQALVA